MLVKALTAVAPPVAEQDMVVQTTPLFGFFFRGLPQNVHHGVGRIVRVLATAR